jgi:hypothetical protein
MQPQRAIYDAEYHCLDCARRRWGDDIGFDESLKDSSGDTPTLVTDHDGEWWETANQPDVPVVQVLECGTCHTIIDTWIDEDRCKEIGYERGMSFGSAQVEEWRDNPGYCDELGLDQWAPLANIIDALMSMAFECEENDHQSADYVNGDIGDVIRAFNPETSNVIEHIEESIAEGIETAVRGSGYL